MNMKKLYFTAVLLVLFNLSFGQKIETKQYDALNRFNNALNSNGTTISYQYDEVGNRIGMIITNNPSTDLSISNSDLGVKLYPNPTSESFCISGFEDYITLKLTDISGKMILTIKVSDSEIIPIHSLPKGIYIVELITKKGVVEKKLLNK